MSPLRSGGSLRARLALAMIVLAAIAVVVIVSLAPASRSPRHLVESLFQDDDHLVYSPTATVRRTLDTLEQLGVDRLRITVLWRAVARDPALTMRPRFDARDPAAYPASAWAPYDRVVELARARGIGIDFDVTAPGPRWAMAPGAPNPKTADHYVPSATEFGDFVRALGRRYSGSYSPPGKSVAGFTPLPRVGYWSIWNEPNQPGWLAPQWQTVGGIRVPRSAALYRQYVDAAFAALAQTSHLPRTDTILVGELAPEGSEGSGAGEPIPPMPFLRALYCVDAGYHPLEGAAAAALGCSRSGGGFVNAHPGLFEETGFAHHPYSFFLAPNVTIADPNFVPLSDLARLEHGLDSIFNAYGVDRQLPVYLTEYGYETNPPNPFRGVSLDRQALYINEGQFIASKDPRVRAFTQFLLYDALPDRRYPPGTIGYWSTFQTGLLFANGSPKPSLAAYRLPMFVPDPLSRGTVQVWGMLRGAPNNTTQRAVVQWRPVRGAFRVLTTITTADQSGMLNVHVKLPGAGALRLAWTSSSGQHVYSREVAVG
jgi:hypothetical protein